MVAVRVGVLVGVGDGVWEAVGVDVGKSVGVARAWVNPGEAVSEMDSPRDARGVQAPKRSIMIQLVVRMHLYFTNSLLIMSQTTPGCGRDPSVPDSLGTRLESSGKQVYSMLLQPCKAKVLQKDKRAIPGRV